MLFSLSLVNEQLTHYSQSLHAEAALKAKNSNRGTVIIHALTTAKQYLLFLIHLYQQTEILQYD